MMMFGLKKRVEERARAAAAKSEEAAGIAKADAMGHELAQRITGEIDQFMAMRARPVGEKVYGVFNRLISEAHNLQENESEVDYVRIQAKILLEELNHLRDQMEDECDTELAEWLKLAERIGVLDLIHTYIKNQLAEICLKLFERSVDQAGTLVQVLLDNGHRAVATADWDTKKTF